MEETIFESRSVVDKIGALSGVKVSDFMSVNFWSICVGTVGRFGGVPRMIR